MAKQLGNRYTKFDSHAIFTTRENKYLLNCLQLGSYADKHYTMTLCSLPCREKPKSITEKPKKHQKIDRGTNHFSFFFFFWDIIHDIVPLFNNVHVPLNRKVNLQNYQHGSLPSWIWSTIRCQKLDGYSHMTTISWVGVALWCNHFLAIRCQKNS